jgi:hypothetical protein
MVVIFNVIHNANIEFINNNIEIAKSRSLYVRDECMLRTILIQGIRKD